jgi:hypothetical protein
MALRTLAPIVAEKQVKRNPRRINWTGKRVGRLIVLERAGKRTGQYPTWMWKCLCDCGNETVTTSDSLRSGKTFSCGCRHRENVLSRATHNLSGSSEYRIWTQIKRRCDCPNFHSYASYGGRGITMCRRWRRSFKAFLTDVGNRPSQQHSIDRYPDNDGNYEPGNVRWATVKQQNRNRRSNNLVTIDGVTQTMIDWAEQCGLKWCTLRARINAGWNPEDAISLPLNTKYRLLKNAKKSASA